MTDCWDTYESDLASSREDLSYCFTLCVFKDGNDSIGKGCGIEGNCNVPFPGLDSHTTAREEKQMGGPALSVGVALAIIWPAVDAADQSECRSGNNKAAHPRVGFSSFVLWTKQSRDRVGT